MFIPLKTLARLSTHKDIFFLMLNSPIVIYNICEPVIDCNYIKFYVSRYIFTSLAGLMNNATIINLVPDRVSLSTSNFHENSECSFYKRVLQHFPGNVNTVVYKKARHFKLASTTVISCILACSSYGNCQKLSIFYKSSQTYSLTACINNSLLIRKKVQIDTPKSMLCYLCLHYFVIFNKRNLNVTSERL